MVCGRITFIIRFLLIIWCLIDFVQFCDGSWPLLSSRYWRISYFNNLLVMWLKLYIQCWFTLSYWKESFNWISCKSVCNLKIKSSRANKITKSRKIQFQIRIFYHCSWSFGLFFFQSLIPSVLHYSDISKNLHNYQFTEWYFGPHIP